MDEKNQITEGVIWKQLLIFFFPIVIGTFFQQIYNTADSIVVGRFVGKEALAAVGGSVNQIVNLVVEVFVGLTSGASVIVAQFYGAKDKKNLNKTLHTSYAFGIVIGFVVAVVGLLVTNTVLELMKTPQELMADSRLYLHIYFCGMIFNIIYNMGASILRAVGDSRRPLYVLMVTCGLNIVLDILLVVIFRLGVMGVAIATVSCQGISSILVTAMLMKEHPLFQLKLREIRFYRVSLNSVLRIGIPAALEATMYTIANLIIQVFVNELGTDTVAAWGTFAKIDAVYWMVVNAFGISITTFVGQNYGAGKVKRMRKSVGICLGMSYAGAILVSGALYALAGPLYRCGYDAFPSAILFHVCGDRDPFRCTSRGRQGPCADAAHLRRSLSDPYCVDVRCISGTSGDQYDHAELPGILGHHGSFVHYLLFQKISKSKKRTGVRL